MIGPEQRRRGRLPNLVAALVVALAVGGCSGSLFQSKQVPPTVYLLSAALPPAPAPRMAVDLTILKPRVRAGLDTDRVAVLYADRRLEFYAGAKWSGPLDDVLQDLAVQCFAAAQLRHVGADRSAFASDYWLEFEVVDFQAEYTAGSAVPMVHVRITGQLGAAAERRVIGRFDVHATAVASENRLSAIVEAYSSAANSALVQLAQQTATVLREGPS